jgi:hypothetical protein
MYYLFLLKNMWGILAMEGFTGAHVSSRVISACAAPSPTVVLPVKPPVETPPSRVASMSAQICLARHPVVFLPETPWPASSPRSSSSRRCRLPGPLPACFHAFASVCSVSVLLSHPFLQNFSFSRLDLPEWSVCRFASIQWGLAHIAGIGRRRGYTSSMSQGWPSARAPKGSRRCSNLHQGQLRVHFCTGECG